MNEQNMIAKIEKNIADAIKYCDSKIEYYRSLGSISKVECYIDFKLNILSSLLDVDTEEA